MPPQPLQSSILPASLPSVLSIRPLRAGFPDVESAMEYLLMHAENLVEDKVYPRLPIEPYLDALLSVLSFINLYSKRFQEANLGSEICLAAEQIALEIQLLPNVPLHVIPKEEPTDQQILSTAALLLTAYQDAVRRVARGAAALGVRSAFGLNETINLKNIAQVVAGIELFLTGAKQYVEYIVEAGLSDLQLRGLESQRRVLCGWIQKNQPDGCPGFTTLRRARILHAAIEYFFDRYAAVVSAKFLDLPNERVRGLKFVPRNPINRSSQSPKLKMSM